MCEQKTRYIDRDRQHVRMGFQAYLKFYQVHYRNSPKPSYEQFAKSKHYKAFVTFGKHLCDINAVEPMQFAEWIMEQGLAASKWTNERVYETYIRELAKKESPDRAVERCVMLMQQWAVENDRHWADFFREISTPLATLWIKSGRISPWVLYASQSGQELLGRLSPEQINIVQSYIDPRFWSFKIDRHKDDLRALQDILKSAGV